MSVLEKAVVVIDVLGQASGPLRLGALAEASNLPKSSLHRLLSELATHGLVRRAGEGEYALGYRLVQWGHLADGSVGLRPVAEPVMKRLRDEFAESVHLYVPEDDHRVCVLSMESPHTLRPVAVLGRPLRLGFGAAGKVLFASADAGVQHRVQLAGGEHRGRTLPSPEECERIRSDRFAASIGEMEEGLVAVASPITGPGGVVVGALSVASISSRLGEDRLAQVRPRLLESAAEIGAALSR